MKSPLQFNELRDANVTRCEDVFHPLRSWSPTDWMTAAAGELGEAANLIKKWRRGEYPDDLMVDFVEKLGYELADVIIYVDLLAAWYGIDLGESVQDKFNIVSVRRGSKIRL